jgi:hypothetical protein
VALERYGSLDMGDLLEAVERAGLEVHVAPAAQRRLTATYTAASGAQAPDNASCARTWSGDDFKASDGVTLSLVPRREVVSIAERTTSVVSHGDHLRADHVRVARAPKLAHIEGPAFGSRRRV